MKVEMEVEFESPPEQRHNSETLTNVCRKTEQTSARRQRNIYMHRTPMKAEVK